MTEGIGAMKNTLFENPLWKQIPWEQQMRRIKDVIREDFEYDKADKILKAQEDAKK